MPAMRRSRGRRRPVRRMRSTTRSTTWPSCAACSTRRTARRSKATRITCSDSTSACADRSSIAGRAARAAGRQRRFDSRVAGHCAALAATRLTHAAVLGVGASEIHARARTSSCSRRFTGWSRSSSRTAAAHGSADARQPLSRDPGAFFRALQSRGELPVHGRARATRTACSRNDRRRRRRARTTSSRPRWSGSGSMRSRPSAAICTPGCDTWRATATSGCPKISSSPSARCRASAMPQRPRDVALEGGFKLRGAIDLIEEHRQTKVLRVTDHKTGTQARPHRQDDRRRRRRAPAGALRDGGGNGARAPGVATGGLFYCTSAGSFFEHPIPLNDMTRTAGLEVLQVIDRAIETRLSRGGAGRRCVRPVRLPCRLRTRRGSARRAQAAGAARRSRRRCGGGHERPVADCTDADARGASSRQPSTRPSSSKPRPAPARRRSWSTAFVARPREGRAEVGEIVAVTFTEKAAGELKLRLRAGARADARSDATIPMSSRGCDARGAEPRGGARQHDPRLLRGSAARAARRSARRSALPRADRGQAERLFNEAFDGWFQAHARASAGRRAPFAAPRQPRLRPGDADEDGRSSGCAGPASTLAEWRDFRARVDARAVRSREPPSRASSTWSRAGGYLGEPVVRRRQPVSSTRSRSGG